MDHTSNRDLTLEITAAHIVIIAWQMCC